MNLDKIKKKRIKSLENAYHELDKMLNVKMDPNLLDPEKRKAAASMYKLAAEDSDHILKQLQELMIEEGELVVKKKSNMMALSPEQQGE